MTDHRNGRGASAQRVLWQRWNTAWLFDLAADIYGWFTAHTAWRASSQRLVAQLPTGEHLHLADLGCGPGVSTFELARLRPTARVVGVDRASRMLDQARRRQRRAHLPVTAHIDWVRADAAALPFGRATLDGITGHSFLYLLPDRGAALAEMRRALRPGGRVVLMEPNAAPATPAQVLGVSRDIRHLVSVGLWRPFSLMHGRFTPDTLRTTLEEAGFVRCQVEPTLDGLGLLARADQPG